MKSRTLEETSAAMFTFSPLISPPEPSIQLSPTSPLPVPPFAPHLLPFLLLFLLLLLLAPSLISHSLHTPSVSLITSSPPPSLPVYRTSQLVQYGSLRATVRHIHGERKKKGGGVGGLCM